MANSQGQVTAQAVQIGPDLVAAITGNVYGMCIKRISITGPAGSSAFAYIGTISPSGQFDNTRTGNLDTSEYPNPVDVPPGSNAYVVWPNATGSAQATFTTDIRQ